MNNYLIKELDTWLANLPKRYFFYLNPLEFIEEANVNEDLGLRLFAYCASKEIFCEKKLTPLLKVKYIIDCPDCNEHVETYYHRDDIPDIEIECWEDYCDNFIPIQHPEKINIYFELLDSPIISNDGVLKIYEKKPSPPLTMNIYDRFWENEEKRLNE